MKRRLCRRWVAWSAVVLVLTLATLAAAQEKKPPKPTPGPEHQMLASFVGEWKFEGTAQPSPFGPGGKFTGTDRCEWFSGRFAVVCHSSFKGPMGEMKGLGIIGYKTEEKTFTYYGIDSNGMGELAKGAVTGNTWTWTGDMKMKDKEIKGRYTMEFSKDSYTFKSEMSEDGAKWTVGEEGKATKVGAAPKSAKGK